MKRLSLLVALAALLTFAGCSGGNNKSAGSTGGNGGNGAANVFRYPIVTNPTTLDPGVVRDGDTIDLLQQVYEGLVTWGTNNQPIPLLCTSWDVEDGGTSYLFHLKKGVKFHNGREMKAEDVKWSIERNTHPELDSTAVNYLNDIVGLTAWNEGKAKSISGIEIVDDYTVRIKIDKPRPYFLGKLTYVGSSVIAKEAIGNDPTTEIKSVAQMIGTGPFKAAEYVPQQVTILKANADYHGGAPLVAEIHRPVITDAATRLSKYKAGEIDLVQLERIDIAGLKDDPKFGSHLKYFNRPAMYYLGLNSKAYAPFKNQKVRQAFAMAVDKQTLVQDVLEGVNQIANSIVPPGVLGHRESGAVYGYDPAAAKALLAEAGFPDGSKMPPVELRFREQRPDLQRVAEAVASQLANNLGVKVNLRTMEWRAYLEAENKGQHGFYHMRWAADYLDPENFLSFFFASYGPENSMDYFNPQVEAWLKEADVSPDQAKRLDLYAKAEDQILKDAVSVPIYFQRDAELINPRVKGLRESLFGHLPHTTVKIEE